MASPMHTLTLFRLYVLLDTGGEFKKAWVKCTTRENVAKIGQARTPRRVLRKQEEGGTDVIKTASDWPCPRRNRAYCSCGLSQRKYLPTVARYARDNL